VENKKLDIIENNIKDNLVKMDLITSKIDDFDMENKNEYKKVEKEIDTESDQCITRKHRTGRNPKKV